jgi:prolipoprotein diacylglyceryltransferase
VDTNPESAQSADSADAPKSAAAKLFDIRLLIGSLFVLYGLMLTVSGFFTSNKELKKAADININLWLGIGMLIVGLLFLLWRRLNPTVVAQPESTEESTEARHGRH